MQPPGRLERPRACSRAENLKTGGNVSRARQDHLQALGLGVFQRQSFADHHVLDGPVPSAQTPSVRQRVPIPDSRSPGK